jgi:carboxylate-amine ligase
LHSARSQAFTKSFPRCGIPDAFGSWQAYRDYIDFLIRTESIIEYTQVWWSIRPHLSFGTVEVRICDAQSTAAESEALSGLIVASVAQALRDIDDGVPFTDPPRRLVEENFWRAIRFGQDGTLLDLDRGEGFAAAAAAERLLQWTAPVRAELGIDPAFPSLNGAQRQRRAIDSGASMQEVFAAAVRETSQTYVQEAETA